jgi:predicted enzyme related to lactoylglutathione lyase
MPAFSSPMINLYARDLARSAAFYATLGFVETFRTPATGAPDHLEMSLGSFKLGVATIQAARDHHGLDPKGEGRWIEIVVWTDDTDAAVASLCEAGAPVLSPAHDFLGGRLRSAWIADPDGNPVQLVQRRADPDNKTPPVII